MALDQDDPITREPMFEGIFYPALKEELEVLVGQLLDGADPFTTSSDLVLSPCASLEIAGDLMARAIKSACQTQPERIILISCAEPLWEQNGPAIYLPESSSFMTPLWESMVDSQYLEILSSSSTLVRMNDLPHLDTFRIEVQLPFIHQLCPQATIVPVLLAGKSESLIKALVGGLRMAAMELPAREVTIIAGNVSGFKPENDAAREANHNLALMEAGKWQDLLSEKDPGSDTLTALAMFSALLGKRKTSVLKRQSYSPVPDSRAEMGNSIEYAALAGLL